MPGGARIVFNLCFVKVIMRDYRFGSMPEISRLKRRPPGSFIAYFLGGCGRTPSDTSQLFLQRKGFITFCFDCQSLAVSFKR